MTMHLSTQEAIDTFGSDNTYELHQLDSSPYLQSKLLPEDWKASELDLTNLFNPPSPRKRQREDSEEIEHHNAQIDKCTKHVLKNNSCLAHIIKTVIPNMHDDINKLRSELHHNTLHIDSMFQKILKKIESKDNEWKNFEVSKKWDGYPKYQREYFMKQKQRILKQVITCDCSSAITKSDSKICFRCVAKVYCSEKCLEERIHNCTLHSKYPM